MYSYIADFAHFVIMGLGGGAIMGFGTFLVSWGVSSAVGLIKTSF